MWVYTCLGTHTFIKFNLYASCVQAFVAGHQLSKKHTRVITSFVPNAKQSHCFQVHNNNSSSSNNVNNNNIATAATEEREERDEMCQKAQRKESEKPKHTY